MSAVLNANGAPRPMKMGTIASPWRYDAIVLSQQNSRDIFTSVTAEALPRVLLHGANRMRTLVAAAGSLQIALLSNRAPAI